MGVSREFQECFKEVSRVFHESFIDEEVLSMFRGRFVIFKGFCRMFQGSFKIAFKVFKKVSCCMALIAASRAEGGLVCDTHTYTHTHTILAFYIRFYSDLPYKCVI